MKRKALSYLAIALISFLAGGWWFINHQGGSLLTKQDDKGATTNYVVSADGASVADIVEKTGSSVVYIEASGSSSQRNNPFRIYGFNFPQPSETATGTGFIIDSTGYIMTNEHVVDGAEQIKVTILGQKEAYSARVVGQDYEMDLAILKIDAGNLAAIPLGDSDQMRPGDPVIAIGNPLGLDHTVTTGVVSAKGRPITIQNRNYKNLIQTDAAINPGNSGGPLINLQGQVIAINTAISAEAQGIGFAIPINTAKNIMQELMQTGKVIRPYLGINMTDLTADTAGQLNLDRNLKGVVIVNTVANSPAAAAGIKAYDVVTSLDGQLIEDSIALQEYIQTKQVGQTVQVGILRNGQAMTVPVTLQEKP